MYEILEEECSFVAFDSLAVNVQSYYVCETRLFFLLNYQFHVAFKLPSVD